MLPILNKSIGTQREWEIFFPCVILQGNNRTGIKIWLIQMSNFVLGWMKSIWPSWCFYHPPKSASVLFTAPLRKVPKQMQYVKYVRIRKIWRYSIIINQAKISFLLFPIFFLTQNVPKSDSNQVGDIYFCFKYTLNNLGSNKV